MPELVPQTKGRVLRNYLIAGLLIWIPIVVTVFVFKFIVNLMDQSLLLLPAGLRPENSIGYSLPGVGALLTVAVLLLTGLTVTNLFGQNMVEWFDALIKRVPMVGAVYSGAKSFSETVLSNKGQSFKKVFLIEYPRPGLWTLAFQTATELEEVQARMSDDLISVFVPTAPNPTSGFVVFVPRADAVELDMEVDAALKMVITLGVVVPKWTPAATAVELAPPVTRP